ncbi:MAG: protein translocase subunit SecD [Chloroflexi bacterium]|nr:protein translocase subunit SecD [Chloroflexota bacterium]
MQKSDIRILVLIALIVAISIWVVLPNNPGINLQLGGLKIQREIKLLLGLDLQGGIQVILQPDVAEGQQVTGDDMEALRRIMEQRVNGLGVTEPLVQLMGERLLVEMPGLKNPEEAVAGLQQTGSLELVDTGAIPFEDGTPLTTTYQLSGTLGSLASMGPMTGTYPTVLTGRYLKSANTSFDETGKPVIAFELNAEGAKIFAEHTAANTGNFLAIVLDGKVISCPRINTTIPDGKGMIEGNMDIEEVQTLVNQLRYGALPVALKVSDIREIGPTLGQDSIDKSVRAGIIGLLIVLIFMAVHYRLPGVLTDVALAIYALITLALYKLIPVTLTLPGIAGFLLSVGMAVDANVLIFERMREELRAGRTLQRAIQAGFKRALSAIIDSNISVWLTCAILWFFGNSFGASSVKGFALTLALGVLISIFTALVVTRTLINSTYAVGGEKIRDHKWLLGI